MRVSLSILPLIFFSTFGYGQSSQESSAESAPKRVVYDSSGSYCMGSKLTVLDPNVSVNRSSLEATYLADGNMVYKLQIAAKIKSSNTDCSIEMTGFAAKNSEIPAEESGFQSKLTYFYGFSNNPGEPTSCEKALGIAKDKIKFVSLGINHSAVYVKGLLDEKSCGLFIFIDNSDLNKN